jgi:hypothetical protein
MPSRYSGSGCMATTSLNMALPQWSDPVQRLLLSRKNSNRRAAPDGAWPPTPSRDRAPVATTRPHCHDRLLLQ